MYSIKFGGDWVKTVQCFEIYISPVLSYINKKFKVPILFNFGRSPPITMLYITFDSNWMETGGAVAFWKSEHRKFFIVHRKTPN